MTHTFAATPARSRTLPRASRAPRMKNPLTSTYSERIQITCAMTLLHAGVDTAVIALWLGHADIRSTNIYLHELSGIASDGRVCAGRQLGGLRQSCDDDECDTRLTWVA